MMTLEPKDLEEGDREPVPVHQMTRRARPAALHTRQRGNVNPDGTGTLPI